VTIQQAGAYYICRFDEGARVNRNEGELIRPVNDTKLTKILITQPKSEKVLYLMKRRLYKPCIYEKNKSD